MNRSFAVMLLAFPIGFGVQAVAGPVVATLVVMVVTIIGVTLLVRAVV